MNMITPLFHADWLNPVFIHFAMDPAALQPIVPFELDTFDGHAYVSLVAFTQSRLRPMIGGRLTEWLSAPLAHHEFLNLRTYVRQGEDRGIYFMAEWIPNRLATLIGPRLYGLPYRFGKLGYSQDLQLGWARGIVRARRLTLSYRAAFDPAGNFGPANPCTLDHFLVERYSAFTSYQGIHRRFDISHQPWPIQRARIELPDRSLLDQHIPDLCGQTPVCAHVSPGVYDVAISPPKRQTSAIASDTLLQRCNRGTDYVQSPC